MVFYILSRISIELYRFPRIFIDFPENFHIVLELFTDFHRAVNRFSAKNITRKHFEIYKTLKINA